MPTQVLASGSDGNGHALQTTLWRLRDGSTVAAAKVFTTAVSRRVAVSVGGTVIFSCVFEVTCGDDLLNELTAPARDELLAAGWVHCDEAPRRCVRCTAELTDKQRRYCSRECMAAYGKGEAARAA